MEERRAGWAERHDESMQLLTRIDERLSHVADKLGVQEERMENHEGRLRKMEEAAVAHAFVTSGVRQVFWLITAAVLGWAANKWGMK